MSTEQAKENIHKTLRQLPNRPVLQAMLKDARLGGNGNILLKKMIFVDYCDKALNLCYRTPMNYWIITHLLRINKIMNQY